MKYISIGGWCGTTISLRGNHLYAEAYPFDHIRSTFTGIIDCFETNFENFFPKKIEIDQFPNYYYSGKSCRGRYFGFYHHHLLDQEVINDFNRRITRLTTFLENTQEKIIFMRTISTHNYEDELELSEAFLNIIRSKYPSLSFILVFVIPGQEKTEYYKHIHPQVSVFTLNDTSENILNLHDEYRPITDFIASHDLFASSLPENQNMIIKNGYNRFVEVEGVPIVREDN